MKIRIKIIAIALSAVLLYLNTPPLLAASPNIKMVTEQADSTKIVDDTKSKRLVEQNKDVPEGSVASSLAYNIIYYLISIFIETNPLSRPG